MNRRSTALIVGALLASTPFWSVSHAAGVADTVTIVDPYVRLTPPAAPATAAFMTLRNTGNQAARLVKVDSPAAGRTELHTHLNEGGVMKMRQVADIALPAGGEAVLKPGSLHVMLIDLKTPLKDGATVSITLGFDDGSSKTIDTPVKKPAGATGAAGMPNKDMPMHKHH